MSLFVKRCTICNETKDESKFYVRYGNKPQPYCKSCQTTANHLRKSVGGKVVYPSVAEIRAAVGAGGVAAKPALKSAGHNGAREPLDRDPEVEYALGVLRDARGQREGNQGYIYCIAEVPKGGGLHYAKIGYSTNPQARVAELQTGNPRPLKLLCAKAGTLEDEAALHEQYIHNNVLQEWFAVSRELLLEFDLDPDLNPYPTEDGKAIE